jgi:hypothetical protein
MTSTRRPICTQCSTRLDYAAVLCDKDTCTSCEVERLRKPNDEWTFFLRTLRDAVRPDGTVHQCDVRPKLRGRIEHKRIGVLWRRARTLGLISEVGTERSDDVKGKNAGRHEPVYRLRSAA